MKAMDTPHGLRQLIAQHLQGISPSLWVYAQAEREWMRSSLTTPKSEIRRVWEPSPVTPDSSGVSILPSSLIDIIILDRSGIPDCSAHYIPIAGLCCGIDARIALLEGRKINAGETLYIQRATRSVLGTDTSQFIDSSPTGTQW